jgi:lactobin A/cerein 7B family class IIb bacteriocin
MEIDMSYVNNQMDFRAPAGIQELSFDEVDDVNGGLVPIILLAAAVATTAQFGFILGVFSGIGKKARAAV